MAENSLIDTLRNEISARAATTLHLCRISDEDTISQHWRLFTPICDLIKASVHDEKSIPHFLSHIDAKVSEMRRNMDASNLNQVVALNILQMFSGFVKFMKNLSHMDPSGSSPAEMNGQIERLKNELFASQTEVANMKIEIEKLRKGGDNLRHIISDVFGEDEDDKKNQSLMLPPPMQIIPHHKSQKNFQTCQVTKGKKSTQLMRTLTSTEMSPAPVSPLARPPPPPPPRSSSPLPRFNDGVFSFPPFPSFSSFSSFAPPPGSPTPSTSVPPADDTPISQPPLFDLQNFLNGCNSNMGVEEEKKADIKRRRRHESPLYGAEDEEEIDIKRNCGESNLMEMRMDDTHGGEESFTCPFDYCGRSFNRICTLHEHTTSDHYWQGALQFQCSLCKENFDTEKAYETHSINCPTAVPIMSMKSWGHEETSQERAVRLELEKKLQSCPYSNCDYISKSKSRSIFKHIKKAHGSGARASYRCDCGRKRRTLCTILFHRYAECRNGVIDWYIEPSALKIEDDDDASIG